MVSARSSRRRPARAMSLAAPYCMGVGVGAARPCSSWRGAASARMAWAGLRHGRARPDSTRHGICTAPRVGAAQHGPSWPPGTARPGPARHGTARPGTARYGITSYVASRPAGTTSARSVQPTGRAHAVPRRRYRHSPCTIMVGPARLCRPCRAVSSRSALRAPCRAYAVRARRAAPVRAYLFRAT